MKERNKNYNKKNYRLRKYGKIAVLTSLTN